MESREDLQRDLEHYKRLLDLTPPARVRVVIEEMVAEIQARLDRLDHRHDARDGGANK
jgi:hypothetical protein